MNYIWIAWIKYHSSIKASSIKAISFRIFITVLAGILSLFAIRLWSSYYSIDVSYCELTWNRNFYRGKLVRLEIPVFANNKRITTNSIYCTDKNYVIDISYLVFDEKLHSDPFVKSLLSLKEEELKLRGYITVLARPTEPESLIIEKIERVVPLSVSICR